MMSLNTTPNTHTRRRSHSFWILTIAYVVLFALLLALRLSLRQPSSSDHWSDPADYLRQALWPITTLNFWAGKRVFGFPLLLKIFGNHEPSVIAAQFALATLGWTVCGLGIASHIRTLWLRPVVFALIVSFSLTRDVVQWDFMLFSESLATSLFALQIGLWCLLIRAYEIGAARWQQRGLLIALALVMPLWSFVRDTNAYMLLGVGAILALVLMLRWRRLPDRGAFVGLAALCVATFLLQNWTADHGKRWQFPLVNVLGQRILVDEQRTAFFAAHGMPTDELVMRYRDNYAHSHGNAVFRDDNMAYFRDWLDAKGKSTYMRWLLSDPLTAMREPFTDYKTIFRPPLGVYADQAGLKFPAWELTLTGWLYIRAPEQVAMGVVALLIAMGAAAWRFGRTVWLVPVSLALLIYPMMFLIWHGDAIEVGRHSFLVSMLLRFVFWTLACFMVDLAFAWIGDRQRRLAVRLRAA